jgi:hypothetical protein
MRIRRIEAHDDHHFDVVVDVDGVEQVLAYELTKPEDTGVGVIRVQEGGDILFKRGVQAYGEMADLIRRLRDLQRLLAAS